MVCFVYGGEEGVWMGWYINRRPQHYIACVPFGTLFQLSPSNHKWHWKIIEVMTIGMCLCTIEFSHIHYYSIFIFTRFRVTRLLFFILHLSIYWPMMFCSFYFVEFRPEFRTIQKIEIYSGFINMSTHKRQTRRTRKKEEGGLRKVEAVGMLISIHHQIDWMLWPDIISWNWLTQKNAFMPRKIYQRMKHILEQY